MKVYQAVITFKAPYLLPSICTLETVYDIMNIIFFLYKIQI